MTFDFSNYINGIDSTSDVKRILGYPDKYSVEKMFKELGLFEEYKLARAKRRANSFKKTCQEKYSVDNIWQTDWCKEKMKQTTLEHFGVEYCSQSEEFKNKIDYSNSSKLASEHIIQDVDIYAKEHNLIREFILIEKYGIGWRKYFKPKIYVYKHKNLVDKKYELLAKDYFEFKQTNKSRSYCEKEIIDFIKMFYDKSILTNKRTIIKPYELDIYLPDIRFAIEENDKFWHTENPYSRVDNYKEYHNKKLQLCEQNNILLYIVNREDWLNNNVQENLKQLILSRSTI